MAPQFSAPETKLSRRGRKAMRTGRPLLRPLRRSGPIAEVDTKDAPLGELS